MEFKIGDRVEHADATFGFSGRVIRPLTEYLVVVNWDTYPGSDDDDEPYNEIVATNNIRKESNGQGA